MKIKFGVFEIKLLNTANPISFFDFIEYNRIRLEDFFAGTVANTKTLKATEHYLQNVAQKILKKNYFPYIITDSRTNKYIAYIDVKNIDWNLSKAELGYFIDRDYEGKGIITEALSKLLEHLLKKFHFKKLVLRIHEQNVGSRSVALKNGFTFEGTVLKDYKTTKGELVDLQYFGKSFDEPIS